MRLQIQPSTASLLAILALSGCGVDKSEHQKTISELSLAKQELNEVNGQLDDTKQREAELEVKIAAAKKRVPSKQAELKKLNEAAADLSAEIEKLQAQESYSFQRAGKLLDSGDLDGAKKAYLDFAANFPNSPRVASANEQVAAIMQRLGSKSQQ